MGLEPTLSSITSLSYHWKTVEFNGVITPVTFNTFRTVLNCFGSPGMDRTYDIFINSEAQLPLCYWGINWVEQPESNRYKENHNLRCYHYIMLNILVEYPGIEPGVLQIGGQSRIRTYVAVRREIYSLLVLTTHPSVLKNLSTVIYIFVQSPIGSTPTVMGF